MLIISSVILIFGGLVFDYFKNTRTVSVELHTVRSYDLQEKFTLSGEIYRENNVNYIKNPVGIPKSIKEGAYAEISVSGEKYDGYLRELEKITDETAVACVSVVTDKKLSGDAVAEVCGSVWKNVILIPENCIFRDENGEEAVMIARNGYVVKRNVNVGKLENKNGIEIEKGLLPDEKIVINHKDVKTGDKYEKNY